MGLATVRILVAEDESAQRRQLIAHLQKLWPESELVAECADGDSALAALESERPDVLFLDIRMPGADGIDVARAASGRAHVVLTTAYEQYAVNAFEAGALDYLLKPVVPERLAATIERLKQRLKASPPDIETLLSALDERLHPCGQPALNWITATNGDTVKLLAVDDVLFFRASDKYVRVVTADDEALVRMSLKQLEDQLDDAIFWRIHRAVLVRANAIEQIAKDELGHWHARLKNHPERLPVSDATRSRLRGM
jgi:DNA-binding LytR/AlgR family response regulator